MNHPLPLPLPLPRPLPPSQWVPCPASPGSSPGRSWAVFRAFVGALLLAVGPRVASETLPAETPVTPPNYEFRPGTPDGLGKWYEGREIAHYMTHQGAEWLERLEREDEERPSKLMATLNLQPGQVVADVGAGSGYFTRRMAQAVGPTGKVYATDIQPEMLAILRTQLSQRGITNVVPVLNTPQDPHLPTNALDLILLVDVYHECDFPYEMGVGMARALKPGGRLVLVEYRGEEKWIPIKPLHKLTEAQVRKEFARLPVTFVTNYPGLPRQHILVFQRR